MRKATENQGDTRALGDCFSPRSKVKGFGVEQRSPSHTLSYQETPMKPSQVPNRLSNPPRRMLPIQTPDLHYRMGRLRQNPHPPGSIHSSGFVSSSPHNVGSPVNRPYFMPKDRLGPPEHFAQPPGLVPSNPINIGISSNAPHPVPGDQQPGSFGTFRLPVAINQTPSFHTGRDQMIESKATSSIPGSKTVTTQRQESNKAQSSDVGYSIPTVQLHRPSVSITTPPFNSRAPSELHPQSPSHSERWYPDINHWPSQGYQLPPKIQSSSSSRLPIVHSFVASCQSQQQEQTPSNEKLIPAVELNSSSHKRRSEYEYCSENPKKLCPQGANSDKTETTKPTVCTTLVPQPSVKHSSVSENQHKTTDGCLHAEQACGQSASSEQSSAFRPSQPCSKPSSHKECTRKTSTGAKQTFINSSPNHIVQLKEMTSPLIANEERVKKTSEEKKKDKSSTLLVSEVPQKDTSSSAHAEIGSHHSGHSASSSSVLPVKTPSRSNHVGENRKLSSSTHKTTSKPNSGSLSGRTGERSKARSRRPVVSYDTNELFTPDPVTYVVSPTNKTAKPKTDKQSNKTPETGSSSTATSSSTPVTESSCEKPQNSKVTGPLEASSSVPNTLGSFPTVTLTRVKLENLVTPPPKDKDPKNSPNPSSCRQLKDDQNPSLLCNKVSSGAVETGSAVAEQTSTSSCQSLPVEGETSEGDKKHLNEEDSLDVELDLGLSFAVDVDLTQSSHSSEDEQLLSLQEMMERATKPPDTPEKGTFSEPSTPRHLSQSKTQQFPSTTKPVTYKNNLDQILKEINSNKKSKEIERRLLTACEEDLLKIAEYEEAEENREEGISTEQQEFLQRYSLMSAAIKEVPPGEEVFNLEKFGQIFNQDTLQLRQCMVCPQGTAQKTLLWSSPAQLRLHVNIGLFQEAYNSSAPCPAQVTRFLFKMMSVHSERMISEKLLQALCDIALTAAYQIVKYGNQQFKVWVPSLPDVTLVLMNMGVPFVKLFPFENLQPPFTEGDLLEDVYIKSDSPPGNKEETTFPEHNCSNILKYLSYCMGLCPRAYSDNELLLLLTVMSHIGLETRLILESSVALEPLLCKIVNNIRDWDTLLPEICLALTDLTDDHHNMCLLVHLLPDNIRGKELRRHLSLCMISKLLDGDCKYRPVEREFQLSRLKPYLPRMQPSSLREMMNLSGRNQKDKEDDLGTLDQQSYYLCYSLLTLANEASNFQFFPAHQKKQLLILSTQLETHVKCDIRESEKCLYRSKVKDLVARIYTKWQMLLQRTRPLDDKLYDYWQPVDTLESTQEEQEDEDDTTEEGTVVEEEEVGEEEEDDEEEVGEEAEEGETTLTEENEAVMVSDEEKEDARVEPEDMKLDETEDIKVAEAEEDTKVPEAEEDTKVPEAEEDTKVPDAEEDTKVADAEEDTKVAEAEEDTKVAEAEEDTKVAEAEEDTKVAEAEEDTKVAEAEEDMNLDEVLREMEEGAIPNGTSKTKERTEPVLGNLNQVLPEMEPQALKESEAVDVQMDVHNMEHVDEDTESAAREASYLAPSTDLV